MHVLKVTTEMVALVFSTRLIILSKKPDRSVPFALHVDVAANFWTNFECVVVKLISDFPSLQMKFIKPSFQPVIID